MVIPRFIFARTFFLVLFSPSVGEAAPRRGRRLSWGRTSSSAGHSPSTRATSQSPSSSSRTPSRRSRTPPEMPSDGASVNDVHNIFIFLYPSPLPVRKFRIFCFLTLPLSDVIYGSLLTGNDVCPTIMEGSMSMENFSNCRRFRNIVISHSRSRNVFATVFGGRFE